MVTRIFENDKYEASSWRMTPPPAYDFPEETYGDGGLDPFGNPLVTDNIVFTGKAFIPEGLTEELQGPINLIYSKDMWPIFMKELFPGVRQAEFDAFSQQGQVGKYYKDLFKIAAQDFFDSFFRGRDDLGSNASGQTIDINTWPSLTSQEKELAILAYLRTRGKVESKEVANSFFITNLTERGNNVLFWISRILITMLTEVQQSTLSASRLSTRHSQVQQSISKEMTDSKYDFVKFESPKDFPTITLNQNNSKTLEDLRSWRMIFQRKTDKASNFMQSLNSAVETQSNTSLEFSNKAKQLTSLFFTG